MKTGWRFKFIVAGEERTRTFYEENYSIAIDQLKEEFPEYTLVACHRSEPERWLPLSIDGVERNTSLFGAHESWTKTAGDIDRDAHGPIMSIIESYAGLGYKVREIVHIINGCVLSAECEAMLGRRARK